jgi:hypothetical protein
MSNSLIPTKPFTPENVALEFLQTYLNYYKTNPTQISELFTLSCPCSINDESMIGYHNVLYKKMRDSVNISYITASYVQQTISNTQLLVQMSGKCNVSTNMSSYDRYGFTPRQCIYTEIFVLTLKEDTKLYVTNYMLNYNNQ